MSPLRFNTFNTGHVRAGSFPGSDSSMSRAARSFVLSGLAYLSAVAACVDLSPPDSVAACAKSHQCTDSPGGSSGRGGLGGGSASTGGQMPAGAGGLAGSAGGAGGRNTGAGGIGGAGDGGASPAAGGGGAGGKADGGSGDGIGGAIEGGAADGGDAALSGTNDDADIDAPLDSSSDLDTNPLAPDTPQDVGWAPETRRDTEPDITPDWAPDLIPDVLPSRLDTSAGDAMSCIQELRSNGYAVTVKTDSAVLACSDCKENGAARESACKSMIDCLQAAWPCLPTAQYTSCWNACLNTSGDAVLGGCVATLVNESCPVP